MPSVAEWWQRETFIPLDWSPSPAPNPPPRRRWPAWLIGATMVALIATAGGLGWLAWQEHSAVQRDRAVVQRDEAALHLQAVRLGALQAQLGADRQQVAAADKVAGELQACINASDRASSDFFGFLSGDGGRADSACSSAEADYQQLQSGGGG